MEEDYFDDTESEQDKIESADSSEMQKDFVNKDASQAWVSEDYVRKRVKNVGSFSSIFCFEEDMSVTDCTEKCCVHSCTGKLKIRLDQEEFEISCTVLPNKKNDLLIFIANATDTFRKIKETDKTLKIILPEKLKLIMNFDKNDKPYIFKVKGLKIHQDYVDSIFPNNEYSVAIGFCRLTDSNRIIDDLDEFKKKYLTDMPKISETIIPSVGNELKIPYFNYKDGEECVREEQTEIEKLIQSDEETGVMMFRTASKSQLQSGSPIIANIKGENEIIGMCLNRFMCGVGAGVILTGKLRKWYFETVKDFVRKSIELDKE